MAEVEERPREPKRRPEPDTEVEMEGFVPPKLPVPPDDTRPRPKRGPEGRN